MIDVWGEVIKVAEVASPILFGIWLMRRGERKKMEMRHTENQQKLDELLIERKYLVPHDHNEDEGPLMFDGIVRRKFNGK